MPGIIDRHVHLIGGGGDLNQLTFSSDGNGSQPVFDENGKLIGIGVASTFTLYEQFVSTVRKHGFRLGEVVMKGTFE